MWMKKPGRWSSERKRRRHRARPRRKCHVGRQAISGRGGARRPACTLHARPRGEPISARHQSTPTPAPATVAGTLRCETEYLPVQNHHQPLLFAAVAVMRRTLRIARLGVREASSSAATATKTKVRTGPVRDGSLSRSLTPPTADMAIRPAARAELCPSEEDVGAPGGHPARGHQRPRKTLVGPPRAQGAP